MVAALDLEKWDEKLWVYGDTITFNDFVKGLEEATGMCLNRQGFFSKVVSC